MIKYFAVLFILLSSSSYAQELNCNVIVQTPKIQTTDPKIFEALETALRELINNRKWTNNEFKEQERINCSIIITINEVPSLGNYSAHALIQSERPVYNSSYSSSMINYNDKNFNFSYQEFENLIFADNTYSSNITSLIAFYCNSILGFDFESFEKNGGDPYFKKAQEIIDNIPSNVKSQYKGWSTFDGTVNRSILINDLLNPRFKTFRNTLYEYHRIGLDQMYTNAAEGRAAVLKSLIGIQTIQEDNPNSMLLRIFTLAKLDELINIFSEGSSVEKGKAVEILSQIDPVNRDEYEKIKSNR